MSHKSETDTGHLHLALRELQGRELSSVEFVRDYLQLRFDGPCVTTYTLPSVTVGSQIYRWGTPGFRDVLCEQIALTVASAEASDAEVRLSFDSGTVIAISLLEQDYTGPEALQFTSGDAIWIA